MPPVCHRFSSKLQIIASTLKCCHAAMLSCPGWAWLNRSCLAGTAVGWLVPMVHSQVGAQVRAERPYRLLSCPGSAVEAAARGSPCSGAASAARSRRSSSEQPSAAEGAARSSPLQQKQQQQSSSSSNKQQSNYKEG